MRIAYTPPETPKTRLHLVVSSSTLDSQVRFAYLELLKRLLIEQPESEVVFIVQTPSGYHRRVVDAANLFDAMSIWSASATQKSFFSHFRDDLITEIEKELDAAGESETELVILSGGGLPLRSWVRSNRKFSFPLSASAPTWKYSYDYTFTTVEARRSVGSRIMLDHSKWWSMIDLFKPITGRVEVDGREIWYPYLFERAKIEPGQQTASPTLLLMEQITEAKSLDRLRTLRVEIGRLNSRLKPHLYQMVNQRVLDPLEQPVSECLWVNRLEGYYTRESGTSKMRLKGEDWRRCGDRVEEKLNSPEMFVRLMKLVEHPSTEFLESLDGDHHWFREFEIGGIPGLIFDEENPAHRFTIAGHSYVPTVAVRGTVTTELDRGSPPGGFFPLFYADWQWKVDREFLDLSAAVIFRSNPKVRCPYDRNRLYQLPMLCTIDDAGTLIQLIRTLNQIWREQPKFRGCRKVIAQVLKGDFETIERFNFDRMLNLIGQALAAGRSFSTTELRRIFTVLVYQIETDRVVDPEMIGSAPGSYNRYRGMLESMIGNLSHAVATIETVRTNCGSFSRMVTDSDLRFGCWKIGSSSKGVDHSSIDPELYTALVDQKRLKLVEKLRPVIAESQATVERVE